MKKKGKINTKNLSPGVYVNQETGEMVNVVVEYRKKRLKSKKRFMKYFHQQSDRFYDELGGDAINFMKLLACVDGDCVINWEKYRGNLGITRNAVYMLRKRLIEKGVIAEKDGVKYINPHLVMTGETVPEDVVELFRDVMAKKYGIFNF